MSPFGVEIPRGIGAEQLARDDADAAANLQADHLDQDPRDDDVEEDIPAGPSRLGKLAELVATLRSRVVALLQRRRPAEPDLADEDHAADPTEPGDPTEESGGNQESASPSRWSPASWTWETRVGMAAVLSFLILVGVFAGKRWGSGPSVMARLPNHSEPAKNEQPPAAPGQESAKSDGAAIAGAPPQTSPPVPALAAGGSPAGGETAPPDVTPSSPSTPPKLKDDPEPLHVATSPVPPDVSPTGAGPDALITSPAGDPNQPVVLPPQTVDAPPLPSEGDLPSMPMVGETKPASEAAGAPPGQVADAATRAPAATLGSEPADPVGLPPEPAVEVAAPAPMPRPMPTEPPPTVTTAPEERLVTPQPPAPTVATAPEERPATVQPPAPTTASDHATPEAEGPAVVAAPPLQPATPKNLETVPTAPPAAARGEGWVVIPSAGRRPGSTAASDPGESTSTSSSSAPTGGSVESGSGSNSGRRGRTRVADGPPSRDEPVIREGQQGSVLHTVRPGENFWTISKDYYNSGRYYQALHKANADQVPEIAKLYVGTVIRVPPPETLERALVAPLAVGAADDGAAVSRTSSAAAKSTDPGAETPPARSTRPGLRRARNEPVEAPRKPTYRVRANDTLRSIARDTLSDSRRFHEIYNLNRDLVDDPRSPLAPGTTLTLPDDAVVGLRQR